MNGNTPYAGRNDVVEAGKRMDADVPEVAPDHRRALHASVRNIAARTREYLPDEYVVGSEVQGGTDGLRATIAVRPPVGNPVTAGFEPDPETDADLDDDELTEVARGLAASAALQVKQALERHGDADLAAR
jgi:hypothetical protein